MHGANMKTKGLALSTIALRNHWSGNTKGMANLRVLEFLPPNIQRIIIHPKSMIIT